MARLSNLRARLSHVRWRRVLLLGGAGSVLGLTALVGIAYAMTDIPEPNPDATASATRILYADRSELGRTGTQNRIPVELDAVPLHVQRAVLAAEDRGFYTEPGISPKGILRALFTNVRGGGDVQQGGSTITQQYAKNAFLTQERTYTRKVKEVLIALKMSREREKDQILEDYLNTIFFGRQSSGIAVATRSYFGGNVEQLTVSQGAVLAAVIRSPANLDPVKHPERAKARWEYVLDGMVEKGWLSPAERAQQRFPSVLPPGSGPRNNDLSGPKGHVIQQVLAELERKGFDQQRLAAGGLVVQTTIRRNAQEAAVAAVQDVTGDKPGQDDLQGALVSVKPETGEVWAYYGGATGTGFDFAKNDGIGRQPGSTFKPYVLATALEEGMSLRTRLDGDNRVRFPGTQRPVVNFGNRSFGRVDLVEATQRSINTAYFQLGLEVGPKKVADLAHRAGIPDSTRLEGEGGEVVGGISLGRYEVQVIDQAVGYATFANGGVPVEPFMVRRVTRGEDVLYDAKVARGERAFSEDTAADATFAMQQVVERGTGTGARLDDGRPAAGKTGTSSDNKDAWFVGFTPQLSTAVWLGYATPRTIRLDGVEVTGGGFSSRIFKDYMDAALDGAPVEDLPDPVYAGTRGRIGDTGADRTAAPSPRAEPTATREPTSEPSATPARTRGPRPRPTRSSLLPAPGPTEEPAPSPSPAAAEASPGG